ncbi:hypothetical protein AAV94_11150 [Lampropedia cohaerens]|uniref:DUF1833 domain-containing protein n=1 Tax=Lampropedia cohaerens TaxID=1610491 RepID=A0A0U1PXZ1_9BURK|nr:DUF1833 family protein [Lampropedia cohaerens]KKW67389.1 hypothetical protein AAV94_11150 [Lampropedia cohaerens]
MTLSTTFRANRQRVTDTSGVLVLVEITHPQFSEPLRLANDTQNWVSRGITYVGYPFEVQLPNDAQGETPQARIVIDNLGGDMLAELESWQPGEPIMCKLIVTDRSSPDVHEITITEPLNVVSADAATVTCSIGLDYLLRRSAVLLRHDPATSPGIFA